VALVAGIVGVGAIYGGLRLLLEGTSFADYTVPGLVLLVVVGGGMLLTASSALRHSRFAGVAALTMGGALLAWGVVETLTIGYRGGGQLVLVGLFVVAPAAPLIWIGWRTTMSPRTAPEAA
jgi:hypothetical protein